jgi:hypothetical protein
MVPTVCQRMGARSGKTSRFLLSSIKAVSRCHTCEHGGAMHEHVCVCVCIYGSGTPRSAPFRLGGYGIRIRIRIRTLSGSESCITSGVSSSYPAPAPPICPGCGGGTPTATGCRSSIGSS